MLHQKQDIRKGVHENDAPTPSSCICSSVDPSSRRGGKASPERSSACRPGRFTPQNRRDGCTTNHVQLINWTRAVRRPGGIWLIIISEIPASRVSPQVQSHLGWRKMRRLGWQVVHRHKPHAKSSTQFRRNRSRFSTNSYQYLPITDTLVQSSITN